MLLLRWLLTNCNSQCFKVNISSVIVYLARPHISSTAFPVASIIRAVVPCQNKIILKNFIINIHEAVLQPIGAFVYCKRHAAATVAGRQNSGISTRRRRLRN